MSRARTEQEVFDELATLAGAAGFAHVIAYLCVRDNFTWYREEMRAEDMQHLYSSSRLIRTEMSTLVGLMLRGGADLDAPPPGDLERVVAHTEELLEELHQSVGRPVFDAILESTADEPPNPWASGSALREPIFYSGEGAFSFQNCDFAVEKYAADDAWLVANRGASISEMIAVAKAIGTLQTEKVSAAVNARASEVSNARLLEAFTFSTAELVPYLELSPGTIEACVAAFSLPPMHGNPAFETLSDFNAVNASPLLSFGDGRHVLFHFNALAEALYESPFYWLCSDKKYAPLALTHRGDFTEGFALDRLVRVFGPACVYRGVNVERGKGATLGEIDVLVLFADRAIVLQAKSKRLTLESRKGNDLQLRGDFKAAVQDAYNQAMSCAAALSDPSLRLVSAAGEEIAIPHPLTQVYPICLLADHYPALTLQTAQFLETRRVSGVAPPLVIDVFTLDAMAELLSRPLRFLSYLDLRGLHGSKVQIHHEITLLSYHLKCNLWLNDEYTFVALGDDLAADVEIAMGARRVGLPGRKTPEGILTAIEGTRLDAILRRIEAEPDGGMVEMALQIYQLNGDSLRELRNGINMVLERARANGRSDFVLGFGDSGIAIHSNHHSRAEAEMRLRAHMLMRKYSQKASSWYGIFLSPVDGAVKFGLRVASPWRYDPTLEKATRELGRSARIGETFAETRQRSRNELCHCGSGLKYKKCHLPVDEGR